MSQDEKNTLLILLAEGTVFKKQMNYAKKSFLNNFPNCDSEPGTEYASSESVTLSELENTLNLVRTATGQGSIKFKTDILGELRQKIGQNQFKWVYRILTGLKIGLSNKTLDKVLRPTETKTGLMLARAWQLSSLKESEVQNYTAEIKYDGIRLNTIIVDGVVEKITSRNGRDLRPSLLRYFDGLFSPGEYFSLDGELWAESGFQTISTIITRVHRTSTDKVQGLCYSVFDILSSGSVHLENQTIETRRECLRSIGLNSKATSDARLMIHEVEYRSFSSLAELEASLSSEYALEEGIILKKKCSRYEHKRSNNWLKIKHEFETLDVEIRAVHVGQGSRSRFFAVFEGFVFDKSGTKKCISHIGSGFSEAKLEELTNRILVSENITSLPPSCTRVSLSTTMVFQIKYQSLQVSNKAQYHRYSCRFPIFIRERPDKGLDDISMV